LNSLTAQSGHISIPFTICLFTLSVQGAVLNTKQKYQAKAA